MAYEETNRTPDVPHRIVIEGRTKMAVTGIRDVESFDEEMIVANTVKGTLVIRGSDLHMEKLSLDTGEILIQGVIDGAEYENEETANSGFFSRIFK